jgi:ribosomal protein L7/L12
VSSEDLLDHGRRIAALEAKVAELYKRLGQEDPGGFGFGDEAGPPDSLTAGEDPRLIALIESGKTIQAIKLYRELTGTGLAEAKDAVQRLAAQHRPTG